MGKKKSNKYIRRENYFRLRLLGNSTIKKKSFDITLRNDKSSEKNKRRKYFK